MPSLAPPSLLAVSLLFCLYLYTHVHTYGHMYTYTLLSVSIYTYILIYTHTYIHVNKHVRTHTHECVMKHTQNTSCVIHTYTPDTNIYIYKSHKLEVRLKSCLFSGWREIRAKHVASTCFCKYVLGPVQYTYMCVCVYVYMHIDIYIYICFLDIHTYIKYIHTCIHIHTQTHVNRYTHTDEYAYRYVPYTIERFLYTDTHVNTYTDIFVN